MTYINEKQLDAISQWEATKKPIGAMFDAWPKSAVTTLVAINRHRVGKEIPVKDIKTLGVLTANELTVRGIFLASSDPVVAGKYRIQCQAKLSDDSDFEECNLMIEVV